MDIQSRIAAVKSTLPPTTQLVAVSKYHPIRAIEEAYEAGQRIFGESHEQELRVKVPALPKDIEWHFIGHLQTNKVKHIAPYISLIHSVDSLHLLQEIDRQGQKNGRCIHCLLQLHVAQEDTKFGFSVEECNQMLEQSPWRMMKGVKIVGLMCMASNTDDEERIANDFSTAQQTFDSIKERFFPNDPDFNCRSWGMSDDYSIAIAHGASLVRIGSRIFGAREY